MRPALFWAMLAICLGALWTAISNGGVVTGVPRPTNGEVPPAASKPAPTPAVQIRESGAEVANSEVKAESPESVLAEKSRLEGASSVRAYLHDVLVRRSVAGVYIASKVIDECELVPAVKGVIGARAPQAALGGAVLRAFERVDRRCEGMSVSAQQVRAIRALEADIAPSALTVRQSSHYSRPEISHLHSALRLKDGDAIGLWGIQELHIDPKSSLGAEPPKDPEVAARVATGYELAWGYEACGIAACSDAKLIEFCFAYSICQAVDFQAQIEEVAKRHFNISEGDWQHYRAQVRKRLSLLLSKPG